MEARSVARDAPQQNTKNKLGTTTKEIKQTLNGIKDSILAFASDNFIKIGVTSTEKSQARQTPNFHYLEPTILPYKNHLASLSEKKEKNNSKSFHEVDKVERNGKLFFHKHNPPGSWMSVLEAFGAEVCRHIAGARFIPKAYATVNDMQEYDGVDSRALDGFKPVDEDPLRMDDLEVNFQTVGYDAESDEDIYTTIAKYDGYDESVRREELKQKKLQSKNGSARQGLPIEIDKNLKNYRTIKALAICLTTSYILEEDDLHRGNLSKKGRIDFDMTLWRVLYHFKKGGPFDSYLRSPSKQGLNRWIKWLISPQPEDRFHVTARDIKKFPDLKDADPFYWPTKASTIELFGYWVTSKTSKNDFDAEEIKAYKALSQHPVFIYHKYATLLKFLLSDPNDYRNMAEAHIPKDLIPDDPKFEGKSLVDVLVDHISQRIQEFRKVLVEMPEFDHFISNYGNVIFAKMVAEAYKKNEKLTQRISILENELAKPIEIETEELCDTQQAQDKKEDEDLLEWELVDEEKPRQQKLTREEKIAKIAAYRKQIVSPEQLLLLRGKFEELQKDSRGCVVKINQPNLNDALKRDYAGDKTRTSPVQSRSENWTNPPSSPTLRGNYGTFNSLPPASTPPSNRASSSQTPSFK